MAKEAPSPDEVRLALLDTNPAFQCLGGATQIDPHNSKSIHKSHNGFHQTFIKFIFPFTFKYST